MQKPLVGIVRQDARERRRRGDARRAEGDVRLPRRRREARLHVEMIGDEAEQMVPLGPS